MTASERSGDSVASRAELTARLARLREETTALEAQLGVAPPAPAPAASAGGPGWLRGLIVAVCLVALAFIAPLSVIATWAHDEVADTDRYVATVAPLADDPAVQAAVSARITDELLARLDIEAVTQQAVDALASQGLPPTVDASLRALGTPLVTAIENFIGERVDRVVRSDRFADAWEQMNRTAHEQMVAVVTGEGTEAVSVEGNAVRLDLGPIVEDVKSRLAAAGFSLAERVPDFTAQFTLFESSDITKAQTAFRLLSALARALPIVAILLLAGAVLAARHRRRMLVIGSLVVAASMLLLGLALNAFRIVYLDAIPSGQLPPDAAGAVYDQLVSFIRLALRAVLVLFLAVALVAWVSGPEPAPTAVRRGTTRALDAVRHRADSAGLETGPVGAFLGRYRGVIRGVVAAAVVLAYVLADHPTGAWVLTLLLVAGLVLLVVELLARPAPPSAGEPPPASLDRT